MKRDLKKVRVSVSAGSIKTKRKETLWEFLCVVPALCLILLLYYYPIVKLLWTSLTDWNLIRRDYKFVGLKNWKWFFTTLKTNHILSSFWITIKYTAMHMVVILTVGMLFALLFSRMNRLFSALRVAIFMPHYIGMSTVALMFLVILNERFGIINTTLTNLGLKAVPWLSNGTLALLMMVAIASWRSIGYDMMIFLSAMKGISPSYNEAAEIDGASKWQQFFKITLPLMGPTVLFLLVTQFISSMKVYAVADVLTGGGPYRATEVLVYLIYDLAFLDFRVDRASVVSILFFLFLLVMTRLTMKYSDKKVNYDA